MNLSRQDGKLTVRWTDPSYGSAQSILFGSQNNEELPQLAAPVKGDTQAVIEGLKATGTYCLTVLLLYTDNSLLPSDRVCTERPTMRKT